MRQEQAIEFLAHEDWFLTAHGLAAQAQMGFLFIDACFDLPAFMVAEDEPESRSLLRVQQGRHQPMHLGRIGAVARLRGRELCQALSRVRLDAILDHAHLHSRQPQRM